MLQKGISSYLCKYEILGWKKKPKTKPIKTPNTYMSLSHLSILPTAMTVLEKAELDVKTCQTEKVVVA